MSNLSQVKFANILFLPFFKISFVNKTISAIKPFKLKLLHILYTKLKT